jgi:hypothetical protein
MKNLVLTLDFGNIPQWAIAAKSKQLQDWLTKYQKDLGVDNIIVFTDSKQTALYWLDEEYDGQKTLEELKEKLRPILCAIVNLDCKEDDPKYQEAMKQLQELRDLQAARQQSDKQPEKPKKKLILPSSPTIGRRLPPPLGKRIQQ